MDTAITNDAPDEHDVDELIRLFDETFFPTHNTRLVRGESEPLYLPASGLYDTHKVIFANGYFSSALHEIAHWCIAGDKRRLLEDYGYWYCPDGRDKKQQQSFEQVEIKPQALEWAFSLASGAPFRVSTDNLNGEQTDGVAFTQAVYQQLGRFITERNFPPRAARFIRVLQAFYHTSSLAQSYQHITISNGRYAA